MPPRDVDLLYARVLEAETVEEAEAALQALAALDARDPSVAQEHEAIGDLYAEVAAECFEDEAFEEAVRLQGIALEHPCTSRRREQGTLLGYRFVGLGDKDALEDLKASRSGGTSDASLLSGFAEQAELVELALGLRLHDEALEIARKAMPPDETTLREVQIARYLARTDAEFPADEDDLLAESVLQSLEEEARLEEARAARQLFVPRDQLEPAAAAWPELFAADADSEFAGIDLPEGTAADEYYAELERAWRAWPPDAPRIEPYPVDVALLQSLGAEPEPLVDDLPEDAVLAVEAAGTGPITWPPGRNDACWCGSGRKYKRCCG